MPEYLQLRFQYYTPGSSLPEGYRRRPQAEEDQEEGDYDRPLQKSRRKGLALLGLFQRQNRRRQAKKPVGGVPQKVPKSMPKTNYRSKCSSASQQEGTLEKAPRKTRRSKRQALVRQGGFVRPGFAQCCLAPGCNAGAGDESLFCRYCLGALSKAIRRRLRDRLLHQQGLLAVECLAQRV